MDAIPEKSEKSEKTPIRNPQKGNLPDLYSKEADRLIFLGEVAAVAQYIEIYDCLAAYYVAMHGPGADTSPERMIRWLDWSCTALLDNSAERSDLTNQALVLV